ncbi:MAG: MBL fold metallo-hydrolase [Chloroflexi bacterium]|nr:MBL fold metallo-hydrolase [Chloroflexota bacterium]
MADRVTIGNVEVRAFVDAAPPSGFPPAQFFPDVPSSAWEPYKSLLDGQGNFRTNFGFFLLRSVGRTVLVDTGLGPGPFEQFGGVRGQLMDNLRKASVQPEDVSAVVITHLHGDHIGWNVTRQEGKARPTFPRARYLIPRGDWEHFARPENLEKNPAVKENVVPLLEARVMDLVGNNDFVTSEVRIWATPGHTPGHISVLISSRGQNGVIVGDVMHSAAQVSEPDWCVGADMDKETARRSRRALLERAQQEGMVIAAGHFPINSNIGKVVLMQGRRLWSAL